MILFGVLFLLFQIGSSSILLTAGTKRSMLSTGCLRMAALIYVLVVSDDLVILALYRELLRARNFMYLEEIGIAILNLAH